MICRGIYSCSERLPIFHCVPDLIAHMLIMSEWYLFFIAILLSWAQHVLLVQACGLCLANRQRFKHQVQIENCCQWLPYIYKNELSMCVYLCLREVGVGGRWIGRSRFCLSFCLSSCKDDFKALCVLQRGHQDSPQDKEEKIHDASDLIPGMHLREL